MKTIVVFYSYTGKAKKLANELAGKENADTMELKYQRRPSTVGAYMAGSLAARGKRQVKLQPFDKDISAYDKIIIVMPVWAQYPAPPFNNIMNALPAGKKVEIVMTSGSGNSGDIRKQVEAALAQKGCTLTGFRDVKASEIA